MLYLTYNVMINKIIIIVVKSREHTAYALGSPKISREHTRMPAYHCHYNTDDNPSNRLTRCWWFGHVGIRTKHGGYIGMLRMERQNSGNRNGDGISSVATLAGEAERRRTTLVVKFTNIDWLFISFKQCDWLET